MNPECHPADSLAASTGQFARFDQAGTLLFAISSSRDFDMASPGTKTASADGSTVGRHRRLDRDRGFPSHPVVASARLFVHTVLAEVRRSLQLQNGMSAKTIPTVAAMKRS